jgi:hypothetical protein
MGIANVFIANVQDKGVGVEKSSQQAFTWRAVFAHRSYRAHRSWCPRCNQPQKMRQSLIAVPICTEVPASRRNDTHDGPLQQ